MANALGFDLGEVYRDVESVQTGRQNREINQVKLDMAKDEKARFNALAPIRKSAADGDITAQRQLLALDPVNGPKFIEAIGSMDEKQRTQVKDNIEIMGQVAGSILQGKTPEDKQRLYLQAQSSLDPETRSRMPAQYNEDWLNLTLGRIQAMDKMLTETPDNPQVLKYGDQDVMYQGGKEVGRTASKDKQQNPSVVKFGTEDVLYQNGQEVGRTTRPEKELVSTANSGPKTSDYNLVLRSIVPALGGTIDDQGNIRGLTDSTELNGIAELAAQLLRTGQSASPIEAGTEALRRYGKTVKTSGQSSTPGDAASVRNFFKLPAQ